MVFRKKVQRKIFGSWRADARGHGEIGRKMSFIMLIKIQPDATVCRYLFTAKSLYMFQVSQHPSSGVLKTVAAASGTGYSF